MKYLVVVESYGKIDTITKILNSLDDGHTYKVTACGGHIMDLPDKKLGIDIENKFKLEYVIKKDKQKTIDNIKKLSKDHEVIIASDNDREGEAIAWSLKKALGLTNPKRIIFNEISKEAIKNAIQKPGHINNEIVYAQQARKAIDKIIGYTLSPLLQNNAMYKATGAGRCQAAALKLIDEREALITNHHETKYVISSLHSQDKFILTYKDDDSVRNILRAIAIHHYKVKDIIHRPKIILPDAPFDTSTLQQYMNKTYSWPIKKTMTIAQKLYENGIITYMRTDSKVLSKDARTATSKYIDKKYLDYRDILQEIQNGGGAHECIRPCNIKYVMDEDTDESKLYSSIHNRTTASLMKPCEIDHVTIISNKCEDMSFCFSVNTIVSFGFKILYDIENTLCKYKIGDVLKFKEFIAEEVPIPSKYCRHTEASLVKDLKDHGIGRPSTYVNILGKLIEHKYIEKGNIPAVPIKVNCFTILKDSEDITKLTKTVNAHGEKNKLLITASGKNVCDILCEYFPTIVDYNYTRRMEEQLDKIACGDTTYTKIMTKFYNNYKFALDDAKTTMQDKNTRLLGLHPNTNEEIILTITHGSPVLKMLVNGDYIYKNIQEDLYETMTLEDAIIILEDNDVLCEYHNTNVIWKSGKYGPYLKCGDTNYNLPPNTQRNDLTERNILELVSKQDNRLIKTILYNKKEYKVLKGDYGPYIRYKYYKAYKNIKVPNKYKPEDIDIALLKKLLKS